MTSLLSNHGWVYAKHPDVPPKAGDIFELRGLEVPELKEGMIHTRTLGVVVAPHTRAFLKLPGNDTGAEALGLKRTEIGEVVPCELVAEVVESKSKKYNVGDKVMSFSPLQRYQTFNVDSPGEAGGMPPAKLMNWASVESQLNTSAGIT